MKIAKCAFSFIIIIIIIKLYRWYMKYCKYVLKKAKTTSKNWKCRVGTFSGPDKSSFADAISIFLFIRIVSSFLELFSQHEMIHTCPSKGSP